MSCDHDLQCDQTPNIRYRVLCCEEAHLSLTESQINSSGKTCDGLLPVFVLTAAGAQQASHAVQLLDQAPLH